MLQRLHKQYPFFLTERESFYIVATIGVLIFALCMVFRPYGLNTIAFHELLVVSLINGFFVFAILLLSDRLLSYALRRQKEEHWTVLKEILAYLWHLIFYGCFAFLTTYVFDLGNPEDWYVITIEIPLLLSIFIIPLVLLIKKNFVLQKNAKDSRKIDVLIHDKISGEEHSEMVELISNDKQGNILVKVDAIIGMQSAENYVEVFYTLDGMLKSALLRNTMKTVQKQLQSFDYFFQCHRSYIINLNKVTSFKGNSKGYQVQMKTLSFQIPVSRSQLQLFRKKLETLKDN